MVAPSLRYPKKLNQTKKRKRRCAGCGAAGGPLPSPPPHPTPPPPTAPYEEAKATQMGASLLYAEISGAG